MIRRPPIATLSDTLLPYTTLVRSVAGGIAGTLWQAGEARRSAELGKQEAENAKIQAKRAEQARAFLERVFTSTEPTSEGVPTALDLLDEGSRRARAEGVATDPGAAAASRLFDRQRVGEGRREADPMALGGGGDRKKKKQNT